MAYQYKVIPLSESGGLPIVNGAAFVSDEGIVGMYVAYGPPVNYRHTTLAIIYKDTISGNYLVGAEPDVMATLPEGDTLDNVVDNDPGDWRTYKYHCKNGDEFYGRAKGFGDIPKGVLTALSVTKLPVEYMPFEISGDVHGMVPTAPWSCAGFKADDSATTWYGDA